MIGNILLIFTTVFLVEIGDKTQLSMLLLSSRTKKHLQLLLGCLLAFFLSGGISVLFGAVLTHVVSIKVIKILSALIFIGFGVFSLKANEGDGISPKKISVKNPFFSGLTLVFIAEIGDKSQIAMALLATKYTPWMVLIMSMLALSSISILTIYGGKYIFRKVNADLLKKIVAVLFILIGILFLIF